MGRISVFLLAIRLTVGYLILDGLPIPEPLRQSSRDTIFDVERSVFLEMSPVASERLLTEEELAEIRKRAARRWPWFAQWIVLAAVYFLVVLALTIPDNPWTIAVSSILTILGIFAAGFGAYFLWRAILETRLLKTVDETTIVYRFTTNGYWTSYNLPTFLSPPPEVEVIYPQGLVIRSGERLWRVFRPVPLVIIEDLPEALSGTTRRETTVLERAEIIKHLNRVRNALLLNLTLLPFMIAAAVWQFSRYDGGWPNLLMICLPVLIPNMLWSMWSDLRHFRLFREAKGRGSVTVDWSNEVSTEWLEKGVLVWREGGEPARWRRHSGNRFSG